MTSRRRVTPPMSRAMNSTPAPWDVVDVADDRLDLERAGAAGGRDLDDELLADDERGGREEEGADLRDLGDRGGDEVGLALAAPADLDEHGLAGVAAALLEGDAAAATSRKNCSLRHSLPTQRRTPPARTRRRGRALCHFLPTARTISLPGSR
jgi:hypothetical protein